MIKPELALYQTIIQQQYFQAESPAECSRRLSLSTAISIYNKSWKKL